MNFSPAMISPLLRLTLSAATAAGALLVSSCTMFPPPAPQPGPPFADGRPRYGHNGTESPNYANDPRAATGQPEIKRDPNNTRVDITPPAPRTGTAPPGTLPPITSDPNRPPVTTDPPPVTKPAQHEDLPFGTPVVGRQGMVYSPYAPEKGVVDVEGLKRGTRVECPYTKKHFRVP